MRTRKVVWIGVVMAALTLGVPGLATACMVCDQFLHCVTLSPGAKVCISNAYSCAMVLPCLGGGGTRVPDGSEDVTAWSLFDAEGTGSSMSPALAIEAGPIAFGDEARGFSGLAARAGTLADVALAFGDEFAVSLVNDAGDGFALRRGVEGARVRLEVRDVVNELPGRVLATGLLGPRDRMWVPVTVAGRERLLVLQTTRVPGGGEAPELARLRGALKAAGRSLAVPSEPLYRAQPQ